MTETMTDTTATIAAPDIARPAVLRIAPLIDPIIETLGHDPRSRHIERYWLPVVGPTVLVLARLLAAELDDNPTGCDLDIPTLAARLGIATPNPAMPRLHAAMRRARHFGFLAWGAPDLILVRRALPPLPLRHHRRLPADLRAELAA